MTEAEISNYMETLYPHMKAIYKACDHIDQIPEQVLRDFSVDTDLIPSKLREDIMRLGDYIANYEEILEQRFLDA